MTVSHFGKRVSLIFSNKAIKISGKIILPDKKALSPQKKKKKEKKEKKNKTRNCKRISYSFSIHQHHPWDYWNRLTHLNHHMNHTQSKALLTSTNANAV